MNELKIENNNNSNENQKNEESYEEYQIIKEDYCSSPKCGIKSKKVTKSVEKIIFSPLEISSNPYFKYCVVPAKDDFLKYDISQSETNHTRIKEEKNFKRSINTISNYKKNSYMVISKNVLKEEKNENEEEKINKYLNFLDKRDNEIKLNFNYLEKKQNDKNDEEKKTKLRKRNNKKKLSQQEDINNEHRSIILNDKRKLSIIDISENANFKRKMKKSQNDIYNILKVKKENNNKLEDDTNKFKEFNTFRNSNLIKDNIKNLKKKASPFRIVKDKKEGGNVGISYTTTNINRYKKKKKSKDEIKKTKTNNYMNRPLTSNKKNKDIKEKINNIIMNNDNDNIKKNQKNKSNKKLKKLKRINTERIDFDPTNIQEKRRTNNFANFKLKIDENILKDNKLHEKPNTAKRRKDSFKANYFNYENKQSNLLLTSKKDKDKDRENILKYYFSKFGEKEKDKSRNKDKDKDKDYNCNNKKNKMKDKNEKIKSKKKEKNKVKEKEKEKENKIIKKYSANNLKLLFKEKKFENLKRKDKSRTHVYKNKNLILKNTNKNPKIYQLLNISNKIIFQNNNTIIKRMDSSDSVNKNYRLNIDTSEKYQRAGKRRNSTKIIHKKVEKEKITEFTNKQNIDNINEYTRMCLEVIPNLYSLPEMPRCKSKINLNLKKSKNLKKIALFDLDETIVHCIGEINMNNVENFTRQCDTKIKVKLPGGKEVTIGINIRPHWEEALNIIKNKYHIIAYTASHESYADAVLNYLDPEKKYFEHRLYRCHCVLCNVDEMKFYVKDLEILEEFYDLKDVVLIDNSVLSFAYHLDNGIPISPFYDSKTDCELLDIANFLFNYADENDIRNKLREVYKLSDYLEIIKNEIIEGSFASSSSITVVNEDEEIEIMNKNCTNNKITLNINNNNNNNTIIEENKKENSDMNQEDINYTNKSIKKVKNSSQKDFKFKDIINSFEKINIEDYLKKRNNSYKEKNINKLDSNRMNDNIINGKRMINKKLSIRKKKKFRSFRHFEINFKKEWDEKQKALNNN